MGNSGERCWIRQGVVGKGVEEGRTESVMVTVTMMMTMDDDDDDVKGAMGDFSNVLNLIVL